MSDVILSAGPLPREIAVRYVPVIRQTALRLARRLPAHICVDDLIGAGFIGLVDAYRRYDPERCDRFDGYAEFRIRGAMLDELRSYDPLSRDLRALATRTAAATRSLEGRLGRAPTEAEVAAELGLELAAFQGYAARMAVGRTVSLDAPAEDGDLRMEIRDPSEEPADEQLLQAQAKRVLTMAVEALPPRLRQVLELYYGNQLTLRDIGGILGVTESRVCQLHAEAIRRLRARCRADEHGRPMPVAGEHPTRTAPARARRHPKPAEDGARTPRARARATAQRKPRAAAARRNGRPSVPAEPRRATVAPPAQR
jgi:RNA polymerase sigma factor for flagellar operon FliA